MEQSQKTPHTQYNKYLDNHFVLYRSDDGAKTVIKHDHEGVFATSTLLKEDGCEPRGCHVANITYSPTMEQIEQLITISAECKQTISHDCTNNILTGFSYWKDRNNVEREYWHGSYSDDKKGCQCSLSGGTCSKNSWNQSVCSCCETNKFVHDCFSKRHCVIVIAVDITTLTKGS